MAKRVVVVGLEPEYNYPGDFKVWSKKNTKYASNHGASLISRTLIKMFDADFAYEYEDVEKYIGKYELCIVAFATHVTDWRDVSPYADFIEKLNILTSIFSLGIQDYAPESGAVGSLHPSLVRILKYVTLTTGYIGVRGFHTAALLYKEGFSNTIPIGCPTMFYGLNDKLRIEKKQSFKKAINVFHRTMADLPTELTEHVEVMGQDFLDEVIFTNHLNDDPLIQMEQEKYKEHINGQKTLENIKKNGVFYKTFQEWFNQVGEADFVFGARLHGCISGIIQSKPALMVARDIRVNEIADFFKIPKIRYEDYEGESIEALYERVDYSRFNELYPKRYNNFITFLSKAGILKYYQGEGSPTSFEFDFEDLQESRVSIHSSIGEIQRRVHLIENELKKSTLKEFVKRIPFAKKIYSALKS
jgi:hypothetical protein